MESKISVALLTFLLVLPFLFRCNGLAQRVSSQLSGETAAVSGSSNGSIRESIKDGNYDVQEVFPC